LHIFTSDLRRYVAGVPDDDERSTSGAGNGLIQTIRHAKDRFRRAIRETAPTFKPIEGGTRGKKQVPRPEYLRSEVGDERKASDDGEDEIQLRMEKTQLNVGCPVPLGGEEEPSSDVVYIRW
jgi:hypothetical protein